MPLAAKLESLGHSAVIMPLMEIVPRAGVEIPNRAYQAICITSANGILNDEAVRHLRATPLLCVGPQSAAAAAAKRFLNVTAQGGDVAGLSAYILDHLKPGDGPILYLSGAATSGDLEGRLTRAGYDVDRIVTYDAVATAPEDVKEALRVSDGVLLYSPRTALLWVDAVAKAKAQHHMSHILHYCLSSSVAQRLPQDWRKRISESPDELAMLATLNHP